MMTLVVKSGPDKDRLLPLAEGVNYIGSNPVADHVLRDPRVSPFHAIVTVDARGRVFRHDISVRNDGLRAAGPRLVRVVAANETFLLGDTELALEEVGDDEVVKLVEESGERALRTERVVYLRAPAR